MGKVECGLYHTTSQLYRRKEWMRGGTQFTLRPDTDSAHSQGPCSGSVLQRPPASELGNSPSLRLTALCLYTLKWPRLTNIQDLRKQHSHRPTSPSFDGQQCQEQWPLPHSGLTPQLLSFTPNSATVRRPTPRDRVQRPPGTSDDTYMTSVLSRKAGENNRHDS